MSDDISLRPYQNDGVSAVSKEYSEGIKRTLVTWPTGCGKTWLFVFISYLVITKGQRVLVIVNTEELVKQTVDKFAKVGVGASVVKQIRNEWDHHTVVASIQTLSRPGRLGQIPPGYFTLIVVDEAHLANAPTYQRVFDYFSEAFYLGVSATLFRGDGQSLADAGWESVAHVYTIEQAIEEGNLVPPVVYKCELDVDLDKVRVRKSRKWGEDFCGDDLAAQLNSDHNNEKVVDTWFEHAEGFRTVSFCSNVQHAFDLANAFRNQGVDARVVWGGMEPEDRRRTLEEHRQGVFPVLCNCAVLTHGYDDEQIECVMMVRPSKSKPLVVQCIGRGLRIHPPTGKTCCLILDFVGVSKKHKLVTTSEVVQLQKDMARAAPHGVIQVGRFENPKPRAPRTSTPAKKKTVGAIEAAAARGDSIVPVVKKIVTTEFMQAASVRAKYRDSLPVGVRQREGMASRLVRENGWPPDAAKALAWMEPDMTKGRVRELLTKARRKEITPAEVLATKPEPV